MMEDGLRVEAPYTEDARYRLLVGAITDYAIYMLDPNGRVTSWNPGAQRLKGYRPRRDHRPALLALLHRGRPACRHAGAQRWRSRRAKGATRGGLARAQGRQPLLGQRRHRSDPRRRRRSRLRQDHPRPDRAPRAQLALDEAREALLQSQKMEASAS